MPSHSILKKLYSGTYKFRVDSIACHRFTRIIGDVLHYMKQLNTGGKTLLDVGTGYGSLLEVAIKHKFIPIGIEPSKNLFLHAKKKLGNLVIQTDLDSFIAQNSNKYDFITLVHVIEHVKRPQKMIANLFSRLKPGGVLYIETPNIGSFLADSEKETFTFLTPPDHINLFTPKSIKSLIENSIEPHKLIIKSYSLPEHLVGILRILKRSGRIHQLPIDDSENRQNNISGINGKAKSKLPFFDRVVAPLFTPFLNLRNKGSILQIYIQKK